MLVIVLVEIFLVCLRLFGVDPLRVAAHRFLQALDQTLNSVAAQSRSHSGAAPQSGTDQSGVLGVQSDSAVFHGAYDPIAPDKCQQAMWSGFGFDRWN